MTNKRAVGLPFGSEREPGRNQIRTLKGPVADVLVPRREARKAGVLRHDAVVMALRHERCAAAEERLQSLADARVARPRAQQRIAGVRVQQAPRRRTAGIEFGFGRAGIADVRLELDRSLQRLEHFGGERTQRRAFSLTRQTTHDEIAVAMKTLDFGLQIRRDHDATGGTVAALSHRQTFSRSFSRYLPAM